MYKEKYDRIALLKAAFEPHLRELYTNAIYSAAYTKYGRGGLTAHRGCLCPSPITDIIICNMNRGRLLKRTKCISNPDYIYMFDKNDKLILSIKSPDEFPSYEIIIYDDNSVIGIQFDKNFEVEAVSEEIYENGRIMSFISGYCFRNCRFELTAEEYIYRENELEVDYYYAVSKTMPTHEKFNFTLKDGYLDTYTTQEYSDYTPKKSYWDDRVFEVPKSKKRKI